MNKATTIHSDPKLLHMQRVAKIRRELKDITKTNNYVTIFLQHYPQLDNSAFVAKIRNVMKGTSMNSYILDQFEEIIEKEQRCIAEKYQAQQEAKHQLDL